MDWLAFSGTIVGVCLLAPRADALLRGAERKVAYDYTLRWWYLISNVTIPDLPSLVFRGFNNWIGKSSVRSATSNLILIFISAGLSFVALALGSYIQGQSSDSQKFYTQGGLLYSSDVPFLDCLKAAGLSAVGLYLILLSIPVHWLAVFFWRWFAERASTRSGIKRLGITIAGMIVVFYSAFPLAAAGHFIGTKERLFTLSGGDDGYALILYTFSIAIPLEEALRHPIAGPIFSGRTTLANAIINQFPLRTGG